jgi:hypothetical protein
MKELCIQRVGQINFYFTGELISQADDEKSRVKIYRTKAGDYIGEIRQAPDKVEIFIAGKPEMMVHWFRSQFGGMITPEIHQAVQAAATKDDGFSVWKSSNE